MKAMYLLIAMLMMMSLASCTSNENDPAEDNASVYTLINTYGARSVSNTESSFSNLNLDELPAISVSEANSILTGIRKHEASRKEGNVHEANSEGKSYLKVAMSECVSGKYTFHIQLNMLKNDSGTLFYSGYQADCQSDMFKWYLKGFSFSCDTNQIGNYKFEAQSYLYFKVIDNGVQYMQVPISVKGTYNPQTQKADFTYNL